MTEYKPQVFPRGPFDAKIMVVGEAPGKNEVEAKQPFVGSSGHELSNMLAEAGIAENEVRFTNVINIRPPRNAIVHFFPTSKKKAGELGAEFYKNRWVMPVVIPAVEELYAEIARVKPNIIIAAGNTSLWALTEKLGIMSWRGSELEGTFNGHTCKVLPIVHPANILRAWANRWFTIVDLRRAHRESSTPVLNMPDYNFILRPSFTTVVNNLHMLLDRVETKPTKISVDIETRSTHIACVGLAWSKLDAICIPFMCIEDDEGYWTKQEEAAIWWLLCRLLTHKNCLVVGQNFLYDNQYFIRRTGFKANITDDTMVKMHVCFPGTKKSLDFISSVFCEHYQFWKQEGKEWEKNMDEDTLWQYNCKDAVYTYEVDEALSALLDKFNLNEQYQERMKTCETALKMMLRGIDVSMTFKRELSHQCGRAIAQRKDFLRDVLGFSIFGPKAVSPTKMKYLCYDLFRLPKKYRIDSATKQRRLTCDKDAIDEWIQTCDVIYRPVLKMIKDVRSLQVFKGTFADARLDWDNRFRCSFNVAGPHTFRWSSSEDAFGFGTNMQNIPKGDER